MYRSTAHYTLSDLPMIPEARMVGAVMLTALADLIYAASGLLSALSWRVESAAVAVLPYYIPEARTEVLPLADFRAVAWEGDNFADSDTTVALHLDPMEDTTVAPALVERPILATLADCRAAFCEPAPSALPTWLEISASGEAQLATVSVPVAESEIEISNRLADMLYAQDIEESEAIEFASEAISDPAPVDPQPEPRVIVGPGAKFRFTPEYIEKMGGAVVAVEPVPVEPAPVEPEPVVEPSPVEPEAIPAPAAAQVTRKPRKPRKSRKSSEPAPTVAPVETSPEPQPEPAAPEITPQTLTTGFQAIVDRKALISALSVAGRAVANRTAKPILSCVRIVAGESSLSITGYDCEIGATVDCPAEVDSQGAGVVNGKDLSKLLRSSKEKQVGIVVDADGCRVMFGESESKLPTFPVEEYPDAPTVPADRPTFTVESEELVRALDRTTFAIDHKESTRFALSGLYLEPDGSKLNIVATDSKRLAVAVVPMAWQSNAPTPSKGKVNPYRPSMLLPAAAVELLRKSAPLGTLTVRFDLDYGVEITAPGFRLHSRQIEGRYPPYRDIIGQTVKTASRKVTIPVPEFLSTLRQVATFTDDESKRIDFTFAPGKVEMRAKSATKGETCQSLALPGCEVEMEIAFDPGYLAEYLRALGKEPTTVLSLAKSSSPAILQHNCESYRYLVMPLAG